MAEIRDFALDGVVDGLLAPADDDVGGDSKTPDFPHRGLRGLRLVLARGRGLRDEGDVDGAEVLLPHAELELSEGLHERHA